jgi:hypothetical protein
MPVIVFPGEIPHGGNTLRYKYPVVSGPELFDDPASERNNEPPMNRTPDTLSDPMHERAEATVCQCH